MTPRATGYGRRRGVSPVGPALALALSLGCRDEPSEEPTRDEPKPEASTGGEPGQSTGEAPPPSDDPTDDCTQAPPVGAGRYYGTLRRRASVLDGACGLGGPDAFVRLEVPRRSDVWLQALGVGFTPRVGVLPHTCTTDWTHRTMACAEGVGTWLLDVAADSSLVVSVGIDPEDPALAEPEPSAGFDPLDFLLEVELRSVLGEGEPCEPASRGRCGSGTVCLVPEPPPDEPDAPPGEAVCTALPGDTCQTAAPVMVAPEGAVVEIDPATPQTDAHHHSCGGARSRERVLRLLLPDGDAQGIEVRAGDPEVGLALRGPGCLSTDERACVDPVGSGSLSGVVVGAEAFLFVELPAAAEGGEDTDDGGSTGDPMGEEAPIVVDIELFEPSTLG